MGVLCRGSRCTGSLVEVVVMDDGEGCRRGVVCRRLGFLAGVLLDRRLGGALDVSVYPNCRGGREATGIALMGGGSLAETLGPPQLSREATPHLSMSSWMSLLVSAG